MNGHDNKVKPLDPRVLLKFRGLVRKNVVAKILARWAQTHLDRDAARKRFIR